ncbi:hypothetical protein [Ruegeria sp.]|uniref:hypothetical protein n=1 Tax=Ruegeria sp. TaxID=1879320 RepID=UPI003B007E88
MWAGPFCPHIFPGGLLMTPTPEDWQSFAALLAILGLLGGAVVALQRLGLLRRSASPHPSRSGPGADVTDRLDRHAERLTRLEGAVAGLASREDIHALQLAIERQAGAVSELRTAMERDARAVGTLSAAITRIEDHLLGESRR